jgi:phage tail protein X
LAAEVNGLIINDANCACKKPMRRINGSSIKFTRSGFETHKKVIRYLYAFVVLPQKRRKSMPKLGGQDLSAVYKKLAAEKRAEFERNVALLKTKAEHKVDAGDTLSALALKYYGKTTKDYWMLIYEANKAVIGDNPNGIKAGTVLKVPELPEDMK